MQQGWVSSGNSHDNHSSVAVVIPHSATVGCFGNYGLESHESIQCEHAQDSSRKSMMKSSRPAVPAYSAVFWLSIN